MNFKFNKKGSLIFDHSKIDLLLAKSKANRERIRGKIDNIQHLLNQNLSSGEDVDMNDEEDVYYEEEMI